MPTLDEFRSDVPKYKGLSDEATFKLLLDEYFPGVPKAQVAKAFNYVPEDAGAASAAKNVGGGILSGVGQEAKDIGFNAVGGAIKRTGDKIQSDNPHYVTDAAGIADNPMLFIRESVGGMGAQVAAAAAAGLPARLIGSALGGTAAAETAGALASNIPIQAQSYGGDRAEQEQKGIDDPGRALLASLGSVGIEHLGGFKPGVNPLAGVKDGLAGKTLGESAKQIGLAAGKSGLAEGIEEVPDQYISDIGGGTPVDKVLTKENAKQAAFGALSAFPGGALLGGGRALAGGMFHTPQPLPDIDPIAQASTVDEAIAGAQAVVNTPAEQAGMDARQQALGLVANTRNKQLDRISGQRNALEAGETARQQALGLIDQQKQAGKPGLEALGQLIGKGEGGYTSVNKGTHNGKILASGSQDNLVNMTIGQVKALQQQHVDAQSAGMPGQGLFAVGKYQFIPETFKSAASKAGLKDSDLFSPLNQERMFEANLPQKVKQYLVGQHDDLDGAVEALSHEWASIPSISKNGMSYYGDGNRSSHSLDEVRQALLSARGGGALSAITPELSATANQALVENPPETVPAAAAGLFKTPETTTDDTEQKDGLQAADDNAAGDTGTLQPIAGQGEAAVPKPETPVVNAIQPGLQPKIAAEIVAPGSPQGQLAGTDRANPAIPTQKAVNETDQSATATTPGTGAGSDKPRAGRGKPVPDDTGDGLGGNDGGGLVDKNRTAAGTDRGLPPTQYGLPLDSQGEPREPSLENRDADIKAAYGQWQKDNPRLLRPGLEATRKRARLDIAEQYDAKLPLGDYERLHGVGSGKKHAELRQKYGVKPSPLPGNEKPAHLDAKPDIAAKQPEHLNDIVKNDNKPSLLQTVVDNNAPEITEHTTRRGKVLRGVVRHDLDEKQAKAIDEYAFKKDGGWFIREKHLKAEDQPQKATDAKENVADQAQTAPEQVIQVSRENRTPEHNQTVQDMKDQLKFAAQSKARGLFTDKHKGLPFAQSLINNDHEKALDDIGRGYIDRSKARHVFEDAKTTGLLNERTVEKLDSALNQPDKIDESALNDLPVIVKSPHGKEISTVGEELAYVRGKMASLKRFMDCLNAA